MQNLPKLNLSSSISSFKIPRSGNLENIYNALKNLQLDTGEITYFTTDKLNYGINNPVSIEVQPSYDGSVNLILNDDLNPPRLINTRFSVEEGNTYSITDHSGVNDTNLYNESDINLDTRLYKTISKIPKIQYLGLANNGEMKCGSYHFYFKYSDADGNETDFISESSLVVCHVGGIKDPKSIRMGMVDENSKKIVKFLLSNLDTSYDYLKVYYTRTTSDNSSQPITTAHEITTKFLIKNSVLNLSIKGIEPTIDISIDEINPFYELAGTVKSNAQCQNILFFGNINKPEIPYTELTDLSLRITPKINKTQNIGNLNYNYVDITGRNSYEYYNTQNIYNYLGYWSEEYYRFGIVYILNDFTLSPVFNVRGVDLTNSQIVTTEDLFNSEYERIYVQYDESGYITGKSNFENSKGVIKLPKTEIISSSGITPLGLEFYINDETKIELKKHTKGFFFVRQKRIPTILTQGCVIGKTTNIYGNLPVIPINNTATIQGFLNSNKELVSTELTVTSDKIEANAFLSPEVTLREPLFNQLFTSSKFQITKSLEQSNNKIEISDYSDINHYYITRNKPLTDDSNENAENKSALLTMVNDSMKLTTDGKNYFSARAGEAEEVWKFVDINNNWETTSASTINASSSFVRGNFSTYVGVRDATLNYGDIINIRPEGYSDSDSYKDEMFKLRFYSTDSYEAINDRIEWSSEKSFICYRGDCFIGNFTQRLNRNFIDPEIPTNDKIVDKYTFKNNFAVTDDNESGTIRANRVLLEYKTKGSTILEPSDAKYANVGSGISGFLGGDENSWKIKGANKINRADVNAVELGQWFTCKVMSNINISMRDINQMEIAEQSLFGHPRGFYPLYPMSTKSSFKTPDSNIINAANLITLSNRLNSLVPDVPFIKNKFDTRILYSNVHITDAFSNGFRVFKGNHYQDLPKTYGSLTSLIENSGNLIATMENGILLIPVNERAIAAEGTGGSIYINTANVLPENPKVISSNFGSIWKESVLITINTIYGVDTTAKKIWKTNGQSFEIISDLKVQKFLNDNINLKEADKIPIVGLKNVKTHYNAFKGDVMFTFYNGDKIWNLCYNEKLEKFTTFYSWCPSYSENINNIFFSFDLTPTKNIANNVLNLETNNDVNNYIWKHGQAGIYDLQGDIIPTNWYNKQEKFELEFIVKDIPTNQKIFNNLKIISNKAKPSEFEFEIVGEGYDWYNYKDIIQTLNDRVGKTINDITYSTLEDSYLKYLIKNPNIKKLPFIKRVRGASKTWEDNTTSIWLVKDELLSEERIHSNQLGNDIKTFGRTKGNMQYLEDSWNVEIRPINFRYAYVNSGAIKYTNLIQARIRDKYIKIKIRYSGEDLVIMQAIKTLFTVSHA